MKTVRQSTDAFRRGRNIPPDPESAATAARALLHPVTNEVVAYVNASGTLVDASGEAIGGAPQLYFPAFAASSAAIELVDDVTTLLAPLTATVDNGEVFTEATGRFTPGESGVYIIGLETKWNYNVNDICHLYIYKNGVQYGDEVKLEANGTDNVAAVLQMLRPMDLDADDYVQAYALLEQFTPAEFTVVNVNFYGFGVSPGSI